MTRVVYASIEELNRRRAHDARDELLVQLKSFAAMEFGRTRPWSEKYDWCMANGDDVIAMAEFTFSQHPLRTMHEVVNMLQSRVDIVRIIGLDKAIAALKGARAPIRTMPGDPWLW